MQKVTELGLKKIVSWKDALLHLIYPSSCLICDRELASFEKNTCSLCMSEFHYTHFENDPGESALDKLFWGRMPLESTFSMLYFEKSGSTQKILHAIKYRDKQQLAELMGELMGEKIASNSNKYQHIDALIPVPLHPKKLYKRGYNQSELLAKGLSRKSNIPLVTDFLTRSRHAESQTKIKNRFLRWDNIEDAFVVNLSKHKDLKHIALVDDVITTGSTLEACMQKIKAAAPDIRISLFSLAITK